MPREKQVTRVRINVEGAGTKSKKFFVHISFPLDLHVLVILGRRGIPPAPEAAVPIAVGDNLFVLTEPWHGNQQWQIHDGSSIFFGADRFVTELQEDRDDHANRQTSAK